MRSKLTFKLIIIFLAVVTVAIAGGGILLLLSRQEQQTTVQTTETKTFTIHYETTAPHIVPSQTWEITVDVPEDANARVVNSTHRIEELEIKGDHYLLTIAPVITGVGVSEWESIATEHIKNNKLGYKRISRICPYGRSNEICEDTWLYGVNYKEGPDCLEDVIYFSGESNFSSCSSTGLNDHFTYIHCKSNGNEAHKCDQIVSELDIKYTRHE